MNLDLASLVQESLSTAENLGNIATQQIPEIVRQGTDINNAMVRNANEVANAAQVKATAEFNETARQEATRREIAARIGTDATKPGWVIGQAADQIKQADAILAAESEQIRQKESVSFLQNPLGWISNQLTINENIANYNAAARAKNRAEETARQAEQLTQQSFQTNNALSSTATQTYLDAINILAAGQHKQTALTAALQGARWNMEGIMHASNASKERLQVLYSANTAVMQEKQFQNELARLRLATASFNLQQEAHNEKLHEDSLILKYIGDGYFNLTGQVMDKATAGQALVLYKSKHPDAIAFFESGLAGAKITNGGGASKPVISLSPSKAADLVGQGKVTNMSPAMNQVGEQLVTWKRQFLNAKDPKYAYDTKDKVAQEIAFNEYVKDQKRLALANVQTGSVFAPFDVSKVAALNKNVAAMPVWKNVIAPAISTGIDVNDPNVIFGVVTNAMREGKISYVDATDLSLIYAAGLDLNNQTRNFLAFGMSPVKSYNVSINVPGTFGKTTVNMSDTKALATALNKAEAINAQYNVKTQPKPLGIGAQ